MDTQQNDTPAVPLIDPLNVTFEQFAAALNVLWRYARELRDHHGWCSSYADIVRRLSSHMPRDLTARTRELQFTVPASPVREEWLTEEGKAAFRQQESAKLTDELMLIKRRVLQLVREGSITLDEANEGFRRMGLPVHEIATPDTREWYRYVGNIFISAPASMTYDEVNAGVTPDVIMSALTAALPEGITVTRTDSARNGGDSWYTHRQRTPRVSEDDVSPLLSK